MLPVAFVEASAKLAPAASVILSAAPLPTIQDMKRQKTVGSKPLLPYSSMMANCCLWTVYGTLLRSPAVLVPNLAGFLLALYYVKSFIKFSPRRAPTLPGSVRQHLTVVAAIVGVSVSTAVLKLLPAQYYGNAAMVCCVLLFASPLAALRTVLREKSAQSIPLAFTVASVANCFLWTVAGMFKFRDVNMIVPNALGLLCGMAQVALKLVYGNGNGNGADDDKYARQKYSSVPVP